MTVCNILFLILKNNVLLPLDLVPLILSLTKSNLRDSFKSFQCLDLLFLRMSYLTALGWF